MSMFLSATDLQELTGRKVKSLQIATLREMGLPFHVNAVGKPVVTVAALEGKKEAPRKPIWQMPE